MPRKHLSPQPSSHLSTRSNPSFQLPNSNFYNLASLGFLALIILTPLLFTTFTSELFEFPKMVLVYAITLFELTIYLYHCHQTKTILLPKTWLTKPILAYLAAFTITTLFSTNLYTSIVGYYTRFNGGLMSTLAYIILFYLFLIHLTSDGRRETGDGSGQADTDQLAPVPSCRRAVVPSFAPYLWAWLLSAALVSTYAILEHFGHDPSCLILRGTFTANCWVQDVSARVFATFGQPNWLATYLVATIPLGLALLLASTTRLTKSLAWLATLLCYAAFWYTYSRSAWFGLLAALGIFILILLKNEIDSRRATGDGRSSHPLLTPIRAVVPSCRRAVKSIQLPWLLPLLLACTLISFASLHMATSRVASTLESGGEDSSTGQIRLLVWQGTLNLIKDHPIIGTGPQTFAYSFLPYRPRTMNDTTEWNFLYNEAHNQVLNQLATTGLLGTIPWLALYICAILLALKLTPARFLNYIHSRQSGVGSRQELPKQVNLPTPTPDTLHPTLIPVALAAGISGVFISQLFGFSVVVTDLLLWLALALLAAPTTGLQIIRLQKSEITNSKREANPKSKIKNPFSYFQISYLFRISNFVFLFSFLLLLLASYSLLAYFSAEVLATQASANLSRGNLSAAITQGQQAVSLNPFEPTYHKDLAYSYAYLASLSPTDTNAINQALYQANQAYTLNPRDQIITKSLISVYQTLSPAYPHANQQALHLARHSLNLAPTDAASAQTLANLQLTLNQPQAAYATLKNLLNLRPSADSYYRLSQYYAKYGSIQQEKQALQQALQLDPSYQPAKNLLNNLNNLKTLPGDDNP